MDLPKLPRWMLTMPNETRLRRRGGSHCMSRYQSQLILATCHVRYHIALWDNRSIGQL